MKKNKIVIVFAILFLYIYSCIYAAKVFTVNANSLTGKEVYPIGRLVGLKLYTNGVLVVGMSEIEDDSGNMCKPYYNSSIKEGDLIKKVNGIELKNVEQLIEILKENKEEELRIEFQREKDSEYTQIKPVKSKSGDYMLGLWVRDSAAGIGTLTFYDDNNMSFSALGHGIDDIDTGKLIDISNGELVTAKFISIVKGKSRMPGEIRGTIDDGYSIGCVKKNTNLGVYGSAYDKEYFNSVKLKKVPIGVRSQIQIGKADLYCQLDDSLTEKYEIEIKKILKNNYSSNKSMLIKVTDDRLIDKTGGIIPGMSGAPIIQNGKLIGAVTNVLLNDPTQGYAIFADMMF